MKRLSIISILCIMHCALCINAAFAQKTLTIYHTNDTHSTIFPLSEQLEDSVKAGRGGYIRRMAMLEDARKKDPKMLLFDSGDFSQGSPYYTIFRGDVEVGLMNRMGYDAATIGNHEFDCGLENMARIFRMANFPIVCANYDFTGTVVEGLVNPYVIVKRNGLKIGVFGICTVLKGLVDDKNFEGVKFLDPVAKAQETADILRNEEKCDLVVCLSHLGWIEEDGYSDNGVFSKVDGVDLVLGGHSHTYMEQLEYIEAPDGTRIADDQNGKHGIYVGKLNLSFSKKK